MLRRRHINAAPGTNRLRSSLDTASWPLRRIAWALADCLAGGGELLRAAADAVRWPFERLVWLFERRLLWPVRERTPGWTVPGHAAGAGALAAVAAGAILAGIVLLSNGGSSREPGAPARVAVVPATSTLPAEQPRGPVLRGTPPNFEVGKGVGVSEASGGAGAELNPGSSGEGSPAGNEAVQSGEGGATTSSKKPVPAGPAAMKVARRFSEAFVFYEIGERQARAKTVFGETATPQLATALGERPPRLPADAKVPKARVVNLVPGPRAGKAYTISVSLLRVGLTSELRLELSKKNGAWFVTDVRG